MKQNVVDSCVPITSALRRPLALSLVCLLASGLIAQERAGNQRTESANQAAAGNKEEKPLSGPQAGEALGEIPVWVHRGNEKPSEKMDLGELSKSAPVAIMFMHEKSRPAFGLGRLMSAFAKTKKDSKLRLFFVILTEDRSSSETWLGQIQRYFEPPTQLAIADGGIEGPGSLGLNRLVAMTILVAENGKVTSNFALTQVSNATDGPAVLKAINDISGGGEIPSIDALMANPAAARRRP